MENENAGGPAGDALSLLGKYGWFRLSPSLMSELAGKKENQPSIYEPRSELTQTEDEIILHVEIPGVRKEEISVYASESRIEVEIEVQRGCEQEEKKGEYFYKCRHLGFSGSYITPKAIDPESVEASYRDGVLEVRGKRSAEKERKRIAVK